MCLLTDSRNLVAPSAQLGQLNSISPRAVILPLMKTLQVGHSHRAGSASSSSSWSHLSVSAMTVPSERQLGLGRLSLSARGRRVGLALWFMVDSANARRADPSLYAGGDW